MTTARNAFTESSRLLRPAEFQHVFQRARKRSSGALMLYMRPNDVGWPRLGLAISRRSAPRAVSRNRIRRIIREAFRTRQRQLGPVDLIFLGRPGAGERTSAELRATADHLLDRVEECGRS